MTRWLRFAALALMLDLGATAGWALWSAGRTASTAAPAQAIAILWGDHERLGDETHRRMRHAYRLWAAGEPQRPILCIGGLRPAAGLHGAVAMCDGLAAMGLPRERLWVGPGSNDTVSNLEELADLMRLRALASVAVVADPLQAHRALLFLNDIAPGSVWAAYPIREMPPLLVWKRVHVEWLAIASLALPDSLRRRLLALRRG